MEHRCRQPERGFTLVELLVVFVLFAIAASLIFQWFLEYVAAQQFQAGVVEVTSLVREARQETLAAEGDQVHGVYFATSSVTSFSGATYDPSDPDNEVTSFEGLTISPSLTAGTSSLSFRRLSGIASATGTVLFTSRQTGATTSLTIRHTGIIE